MLFQFFFQSLVFLFQKVYKISLCFQKGFWDVKIALRLTLS